MNKIQQLIREVQQELLQEGLLRGQMEMSQSEFGDFIKSYKKHVDGNSQYNGVLTLGKENWDGDDNEDLTYVGYVDKSNIHFRFFPVSNEFFYDTEILPKPFVFVHQSDFKSSGKLKTE
jgi:hypothetical protein